MLGGEESKKEFLKVVATLFPNNTFPPDPRDTVALEALDDIVDYDFIYKDATRSDRKELEDYEVCVDRCSNTMKRHAALYGLFWALYHHDNGSSYFLAKKQKAKVEEVDEIMQNLTVDCNKEAGYKKLLGID